MPNLNNTEMEQIEQLQSFFEIWYKSLGTHSISVEDYKTVFELYKSCIKEGNLSQELQSLFFRVLFDTKVNFKSGNMNQIWEVINYRNEILDMCATSDESISR